MNVRALGLAAAALLALSPAAHAQITGTPSTGAAAPGAAPKPADAPAEPAGDPVVGRVNGVEIHRSEVQTAIAGLPKQYRDLPQETLFPSVLQQIVDRQLLADAAKKSNLDKDPDVQKRFEEVKERVLQEAYLTKAIDADVSEAKVRAAYEETVKKMPPQEEVHARHILVKTEDEAKAIKKELDSGGDFAKLADQKSSDGTAKNGGDLGFFTKDQMVPEFSDAAFKLKPGEISGPVKSPFGWHIIKLEERRPVAPPSFEQMQEEIRNQLAQAAVAKTIEGLRKDAKIETFNPDGSPTGAMVPVGPASTAKPATP
jgi:peptidyl-prolyl cis-trans isomerase C